MPRMAAVTSDLLFDGRPVTAETARREGVPRRTLTRRRNDGTLRCLFHGVWIDSRVEATLPVRAAAVGLVLPAGAALCRRTAAWLHDVDTRSPGDLLAPMVVECVVRRGRMPPRRPGLLAYSADLRGDVEERAGVPTTTAHRTAQDLARYAPPHLGLAAVDALAHQGAVDKDALLVGIERWRGERFVDRARRLLALCEPATESFGESWLRLRLVDAGFPRPEVQIPVVDDLGREVYRLDMGDRLRRLAWEYDGEHHHSSPAQREHDRRRREDLERRFGWTVLAVGRAEVLGRSMALERAVGAQLGMEPQIRRRLW